MKSLHVPMIVLFLLIVLVPVRASTTSSAKGALNWNWGYVDSDFMAEGEGFWGQWKIEYQGDGLALDPGLDGYCVGIVKYKTMAYVQGNAPNTPTAGWAWGYYATEKPDVGFDCSDMRSLSEASPLSRPGFLLLHGNTGRGGIKTAAGMATALTGGSAGPAGAQDPFVLAVSAPGQGYECGAGAPDEDAIECLAVNNQFDQISHGEGMEPITEWSRGFPGYGSGLPVNSKECMMWGYVNSGMRAVNVFKKVFDQGSGQDIGFTNGKLVVAGISAGGIATLNLNGVDSRPDAVITLMSAGALFESVRQTGSSLTLFMYATGYGDSFNPAYSIDCDDVGIDPLNYTELERKGCQTFEYIEPLQRTPLHPVLMLCGAQDEPFPVNAFEATYDYLSGFGQPVFRHYVADLDHACYLNGMGLYETYLNQTGLARFGGSLAGFFQAVSVGANPLYPEGPFETVVGKEDLGGDTLYRVASCWFKPVFPPKPVGRFSVTVDSFYHILPACTNGLYDSSRGMYLLSDTTYDYNSICYDTVQEAYATKCPSGTVNTGDTFRGKRLSESKVHECRTVDIGFAGIDPPDRFSAWVDVEYDWRGFQVVSSGKIVSIPDEPYSPCIRPRQPNVWEALSKEVVSTEEQEQGESGMYRIRDDILKNSEAGQTLSDIVYRHALELAALCATDSRIRSDLKAYVAWALKTSERYFSGKISKKEVVLKGKHLNRMRKTLKRIRKKGSKGLKEDLVFVEEILGQMKRAKGPAVEKLFGIKSSRLKP